MINLISSSCKNEELVDRSIWEFWSSKTNTFLHNVRVFQESRGSSLIVALDLKPSSWFSLLKFGLQKVLGVFSFPLMQLAKGVFIQRIRVSICPWNLSQVCKSSLSNLPIISSSIRDVIFLLLTRAYLLTTWAYLMQAKGSHFQREAVLTCIPPNTSVVTL